MGSLLVDQLISSHVVSSNDPVIDTSRENHVGIDLIRVKMDLSNRSSMSLSFLDGFGSIDVPEGDRPVLAARNNQGVVPLEGQACVFVTFEK